MAALHDIGLIPAWAPRTMQDARIRGRKSVEDLVDRPSCATAGSGTC